MRPALLFLVLSLAACDPPNPCAGSKLADRGLVLQDDHLGWERPECFDCHVAARIHRDACLPEAAVDPERWDPSGDDCTSCHGGNGNGADSGSAR